MSNKKAKSKPRGPKAKRLKIDLDWETAVGKALKVKPPQAAA